MTEIKDETKMKKIRSNDEKEKGGEKLTNNDYYEATPPNIDKDIETQDGRNEKLYPEILLSKKYRNHFITIPQSSQDMIELKQALQNTSKNIIYTLISQELHQDGGKHFHINVAYKESVLIKAIHKRIISIKGDIKGSINYQNVKNSEATINYIKKDGNFIEEGIKPKNGRPNIKVSQQNKINEDLSLVLNDDSKTVEEKLNEIKEKQPAYYIQNSEKIKNVIEKEIKKDRFEYTVRTSENTKLNAWEEKLWKIINEHPKQRRIIWVYGKPGTGKSFMFNYIQDNFTKELYSAGQSASADNVIYGYDGEGVIAWDLPKNFNFNNEELVNSLTSVIEKFSDFGQILTSKKYTGKKQRVLGHTVVFSNREPLDQLKHRDLVIIKTDQEKPKYKTTKTVDGNEIYQVETGKNNTKYFYNKEDLEEYLENNETENEYESENE